MLAQILWAIVLVPLLLVGGFLVLLYLKARQRSRFPPPAVRTRTRSSTSTSSNAPTPFAYVGWQLVCDRHFRLRHWHRPRDRQVPREARLPCRGDGAESRGTRRGSPSLSVPPSHAESLRTRGVRSWARVSRTRRLERSRTIKSISRTTSRFKRYATTHPHAVSSRAVSHAHSRRPTVRPPVARAAAGVACQAPRRARQQCWHRRDGAT